MGVAKHRGNWPATAAGPGAIMTAKTMSGLQLQVLALYRECLRVARTKAPALQADIKRIAGQEFREHKGVARTDIERIEYLLRRGAKQLDRIRPANVQGVSRVHSGR